VWKSEKYIERDKDREREIEREWGSSSFLLFYLKLGSTCFALSPSTLETIQKATALLERLVCVS